MFALADDQDHLVIDQLLAVLFDDVFLQRLDALVDELGDLAGIYVNHVVMMLFRRELVDRMPFSKVMTRHDAGRFELSQDAVDGRQPDGVVRIEQGLVDVFGAQMVGVRALEYFQDFQPG